MSVPRFAGLTVLVALVAARALAQTPSPQAPPPPAIPQDPIALTFEVSPDHDAVDPSGPRVLKYLIEFSPVDGLGKAKTVDLGKPPSQDGLIIVRIPPLGLAPGRYMAQARVVGPTTSAVSGAVGPFQLGKPKPSKSADPPATTHQHAPSPSPAPAAPNSAAPAGSGDHASPAQPRTDDGDAKRRGFWQRLYGLIVG